MHADLDDLITELYVIVDDFLPKKKREGRPPLISDSEIICCAVAQVLLDCPNETRFLRLVHRRLGHLFPYIPGQSGYNKRLRTLSEKVVLVLNQLAQTSPSYYDSLRLLDSTPVPCAASRETVKRSSLAGYASYGWCSSHSRYFWGFRLYILCCPDGMPIGFELAAANAPERQVAAGILERVIVPGQTVISDKGFIGEEFEQLVSSLGATLLRPDRKNAIQRKCKIPLGKVRQWVESVFWTFKGQLSLERHGARTMDGLIARVCQRLLALAAGIWYNHRIGLGGRHLVAHDH